MAFICIDFDSFSIEMMNKERLTVLMGVSERLRAELAKRGYSTLECMVCGDIRSEEEAFHLNWVECDCECRDPKSGLGRMVCAKCAEMYIATPEGSTGEKLFCSRWCYETWTTPPKVKGKKAKKVKKAKVTLAKN